MRIVCVVLITSKRPVNSMQRELPMCGSVSLCSDYVFLTGAWPRLYMFFPSTVAGTTLFTGSLAGSPNPRPRHEVHIGIFICMYIYIYAFVKKVLYYLCLSENMWKKSLYWLHTIVISILTCISVWALYVLNVYCELYVVNRFFILLKTEEMPSNCYLTCICAFKWCVCLRFRI